MSQCLIQWHVLRNRLLNLAAYAHLFLAKFLFLAQNPHTLKVQPSLVMPCLSAVHMKAKHYVPGLAPAKTSLNKLV